MIAPPLTWLYVPGDRPDRFAGALASGADVVIIDLEDAVHPDHKDAARDNAARLLATVPSVPVEVRINDLDSPWGLEDLTAIGATRGLTAIRIPKVREAADVVRVASHLPAGSSIALSPLIESALGVEAAFEIASAHASVAAIGLGEQDLGSDLGVYEEGLAYARGRVINAARAAGLPSPAMSVWIHLRDLDGLAASCRSGKALGFLGRAAIHPAQLPAIVEAFTPSADEVERARTLLDRVAAGQVAGGGGLVLADGRFVDRAMVALAERTLRLYSRHRQTA